MSQHEINGSLLSRHTTLPNAFVYTPIKNFSTKNVWVYLLQVPSPWGNNNRDLVTMYRNAQAGECPLVVDTTTPSCGNSRFGCWVCTVVTRDTSMESMIDNGEDWMMPLLEYRNMLASTQDVNVKSQVRYLKRLNGQVMTKSSGEGFVYGQEKMDLRRKLLSALLETQKQIRSKGPKAGETLITPEELEQIRRIWRTEEQDWEDSVPKIYREVTSEDLDWIADELPAFSNEERKTLDHVCARHGVSPDMVAKLLDVERAFHAISRRAGVYQKISLVLAEEWRSEEAILASGEKSEE